jgi:hypothetical protein
MIPPSASCDVD